MIVLTEISKKYGDQFILEKCSLKIYDGDFFLITGESGKGKTTLLNIMGLLDRDYEGILEIDGVKKITKKEIRNFQRYECAYLFQNYALIENETIKKNLDISLKFLRSTSKKQKEQLMKNALEIVNINLSLNKKIYELSGGEQQRIALARAYLKKPKYLFADEPTGNLDVHNRDLIVNVLQEMNRNGTTIVMVTHDLSLVNHVERTLEIK